MVKTYKNQLAEINKIKKRNSELKKEVEHQSIAEQNEAMLSETAHIEQKNDSLEDSDISLRDENKSLLKKHESIVEDYKRSIR